MNDKSALQVVSTVVDHKAIIAQVASIQGIMNSVMKEEVHYGVIPGCNQPSLFKAGSEALLSAFKIAVDPEVEREVDLVTGHITFHVRAKGIHMQSGVLIGVGVGNCSTSEEKYAWRNSVCQEEFDETPETHKRTKYSNYKGVIQKRLMVRTNPADIANTCLKMAKKRAQIDLTLTSLAASDIFTQDLEDLPAEYTSAMPEETQRKQEPQARQPKEKQKAQDNTTGSAVNGVVLATEAQIRLVKTRLEAKKIPVDEMLEHFKREKIESIEKAEINKVLDWIQAHA